jgi:hypothetical protein
VEDKNEDPIVMEIGIVPSDYEVVTATVDILRNDVAVATLPVTFNSPGEAVLQPGFQFNTRDEFKARVKINEGIPGRELTREKDLQPAKVEFASTAEVEVEEQGKKRLLDVAKLYEARPRVRIDSVPVNTMDGPLTGTIEDDLAPVQDLWVNGTKVKVENKPPRDYGSRDEIGPFPGDVHDSAQAS